MLRRWSRNRTTLVRVEKLIDHDRLESYVRQAIKRIDRAYATASVSIECVPLASIRSLSRVVEGERFDKASRIVRLMQRRRYPLFEPTLLRFSGEHDYRLVIPPVVEETKDGLLVLVDGVHRLAVLSERRRPPAEVRVVVVRRTRQERSWATPVNLSDVRISREPLPRDRKFRRLKKDKFLPTGKVLRSARFRYDSPERFVASCDRVARTTRTSRTTK